MTEIMLVYMMVSVSPGVNEARPFVRLKNGEYCELFSPLCTIQAEHDYGSAEVEQLRREVLNNWRKSHQ